MIRNTFALCALLAVNVAADCSRQTLQEAADQYVSSIKNGKLSLDTASTAKYSENFKDLDVAKGLLSKPITLAYDRSLLDTVNCATFTELIAPNNTPPYVVATQMYLDPSTKKVIKIDSVVNKPDGWFFNATATLYYALSEDHGVIPPEKRDTREAIKAAAEHYFETFSDASAMKRVPWNTPGPCSRVEGGMRLSPSCQIGINPPAQKGKDMMTNRRYVIDETVGSVDVMLSFGGFAPDSHEFRLENGKIRYIRAFSDMPSLDRLPSGSSSGTNLGNLLGGANLGNLLGSFKDAKVEGLNIGALAGLLGGKRN